MDFELIMQIAVPIVTAIAGYFIPKMPKKYRKMLRSAAKNIRETADVAEDVADGKVTKNDVKVGVQKARETYNWIAEKFGDEDD